MKKSTFISIVLLLLLGSACETPAHFDIKNDPVLVINAIFLAGEDSTAVQFSQTKPVNSDAPWAVIEKAEIRLFENDVEVAKAIENSGEYHFDYPIQPATTYRVLAEHPSHGSAWGETTVPASFLEASIDTADIYIVNQWLDNPEEKNVYWLGLKHIYGRYGYEFSEELGRDVYVHIYDYDSFSLRSYLYTTSTLVDMFNYTFDHSAFITSSYECFLRVEDSGHSGKQLELSYLGSKSPQIPFILSLDKHYDAYIKSVILRGNDNNANETFPLFYKPSYIYSNIHGGVGIVGSYVRFQRYFNVPEEFIPE